MDRYDELVNVVEREVRQRLFNLVMDSAGEVDGFVMAQALQNVLDEVEEGNEQERTFQDIVENLGELDD